jgi:hypothetical protein
MHNDSPRVRALPLLAHMQSQSVGEGARGGEPEVLPRATIPPTGFEPVLPA